MIFYNLFSSRAERKLCSHPYMVDHVQGLYIAVRYLGRGAQALREGYRAPLVVRASVLGADSTWTVA